MTFSLRFLWIAAGLLVAGTQPLLAAPIVCAPGEPDFVYEDVGSDGCFNMGIDTQIPDSSLLGVYVAPAGSSIVVPTGVSVAPDAGVTLDWKARSVFVRGKIKTTDGSFVAEAAALGRHELVGSITQKGSGTLVLQCAAPCTGSVFGTASKLAADGNVVASMGAVIEDAVSIASKTGTVTLAFSSIGADFSVKAAQAVTTTANPPASVGTDATFVSDTGVVSVSGTGNPSFNAAAGLTMTGGGLSVSGGGSIQIGDGAKLTCTDMFSCTLSNGTTRTLGNDVKFVSATGISISGSGDCTVGDRLKIAATNSISFSNGGAHTFGNQAKMSSESTISISGSNDITVGTAAKIKGTSISLSNGGARSIGANSKLTGANTGGITLSGGGANTIGDSVKIKGGNVFVGSGGAAGLFGEGNSITATSSGVSLSFGGLITIGTGAKVKGHGVSVNSGTGRNIGPGAKFDAIDGTLSIGTNGITNIGAGAKLSGATVSISHSGDLTIDPDSNTSATNGSVIFTNGGNISVGDGAKIKATTSVTLSNSNARTLGIGTNIGAGGAVTIEGTGGATTIADGSSLTGTSLYVEGNTIIVGNKVALKTAGAIEFAGPSHQTFGDKLKLKSLGDLTFITGGNIVFGEKPMMSANAIDISNGSAMQFGDKAKLKALGSLTLEGNLGVNLGLGAKLMAGTDLTIESNDPNSVTIISDAKIKSGTEKAEMDPASVLTVEAGDITITDSALSGADAINQIAIVPYDDMLVTTSKITGKTITVGSATEAPFTTFFYTADATKGSDDPSTITFIAPASTCNLTGSVFTNITLDTTSCASVVGP